MIGALVICFGYAVLVWLVFFKFKWLKFSIAWGVVSVFVGLHLVIIFMIGLRFVTPYSTDARVIQHTIQLTPRLSEPTLVTAVLVEQNVLLVQIDDSGFAALSTFGGVIPPEAKLTPWPKGPPAELKEWDELTADEKKMFIRQVEVFAAYHAYTDHEAVDEWLDVGYDTRTGVDERDDQVPFRFTGTINRITFKPGPPEMTQEQMKRVGAMNARGRD